MNRSRRIYFDWQIGLIGLSALAGLAIAYNWRMAALQFVVVTISIVLYLCLASVPEPITLRGKPRSVLSAMVAVLPAAISAIFLLSNNWSLWIGKVPVLDPVLRLLAGWLPGTTGQGLNPNVVGGSLAALLPLQVFALRHARRWVSVLLISLAIIGLGLSQTRGAWLALILALGMGAMWKAVTQRVTDERHARRVWITSMVGCGAVVIGFLILSPFSDQLLGLGGDRRVIWSNSLDLIGDYPFTGAGLAGFEMAYSTYSLLVHVGHTVHAHNLWLDMWLNQGIIGVIALAGMVLNAVWPKPSSAWRMPSLLSLGVILLHSLVDDPYYGYGGAALPAIFIPLGLLARSDFVTSIRPASKRSKFQPAFAVWGGAAALFLIGFLTPMGRAAIDANLGALIQTGAELSKYNWPNIPIQDALRRPGVIDLNTAEAHYRAALAIDPANATANRRLGQIELAREQFEAACGHMEAAYRAAPQQRATRQMLGECNAITGRIEEAVKLWKTVDVSQNQLSIRQWWYNEYLQDHGHAAQFQSAMSALSRE